MDPKDLNWKGLTAVCVGSGPSLLTDNVALTVGYPTIAVNNSWEVARHCDVIYAGDIAWWKHNIKRIDIEAQRWTCSRQAAQEYKINLHVPGDDGWNSGLRAIQLAAKFGANKIVLLGYDCKSSGGKKHWHADHGGGMENPNVRKYQMWNVQFIRLSKWMQKHNIEVVNASRDTALTCFPRVRLEEALWQRMTA